MRGGIPSSRNLGIHERIACYWVGANPSVWNLANNLTRICNLCELEFSIWSLLIRPLSWVYIELFLFECVNGVSCIRMWAWVFNLMLGIKATKQGFCSEFLYLSVSLSCLATKCELKFSIWSLLARLLSKICFEFLLFQCGISVSYIKMWAQIFNLKLTCKIVE